MDSADYASKEFESFLESSIAAARGVVASEIESDYPIIKCRICGETIPEARRQLLPTSPFCIDRAETIERRNASHQNHQKNPWFHWPRDEIEPHRSSSTATEQPPVSGLSMEGLKDILGTTPITEQVSE